MWKLRRRSLNFPTGRKYLVGTGSGLKVLSFYRRADVQSPDIRLFHLLDTDHSFSYHCVLFKVLIINKRLQTSKIEG